MRERLGQLCVIPRDINDKHKNHNKIMHLQSTFISMVLKALYKPWVHPTVLNKAKLPLTLMTNWHKFGLQGQYQKQYENHFTHS